jgi:phage terminase large subunit
MKVLDRINLQLGWIAKGHFFVTENCKEHIRELGVYSWKDDKDEPEDANDHTINACQYGWLPFVGDIGKEIV